MFSQDPFEDLDDVRGYGDGTVVCSLSAVPFLEDRRYVFTPRAYSGFSRDLLIIFPYVGVFSE